MSEMAIFISASPSQVQVGQGVPAIVDFHEPVHRPHEPVPPPPNDICQKIKKCLDELDLKEHEIFRQRMELKSRWNCSLVIARLPNEILFLIFVRFSKSLPQAIEERFKFGLAKPGWTELMLVCRHWCDVVRTTPALWRTIDVGETSNWINLVLARSATAAIDVSFCSGLSEEHASLLQPHYNRLRSLRLQDWSPSAPGIMCHSLPALETLEIHGDTPRVSYVELEIPREQFPSLKIMVLTGTTIPKDPLFYASLRKLSLKACPCEFSLEQFVQLLSNSLGLEHLELDQFLQPLCDNGHENDTQRTAPAPWPLPSLISLHLRNYAPIHSSRFLSRIVIPQTASLRITAKVGHAELEQGDNSAPSTLLGLAAITQATLVVDYNEYLIECETMQPGPYPPTLMDLSLLSSIGIHWDDHQFMPRRLNNLIAVISPAPLTHLDIIGDCTTVDSETWVALFRTFPSLLSLNVGASEELFAALREVSAAGPTDEPPACPGLGRITIDDYWGALEEMEAFFDTLVGCLRYRTEGGTRLKELQMHLYCPNAEGDKYLPQLQDLVSNVEYRAVVEP
ncbi:hypothetical protein LXA43DRAFT_1043807 [Ganoderma leucocontextum]|nr:hypothetical protein LXA43DRAFT_1043807 [Ganoderma leucocontextum]